MTNKLIHIIGGGTMFHLRNHFSLVAPAYGTTATQLASLCYGHPDNKMDIQVHLSKMCKQITPQLSPSISLFRGEIFETHQQLDALTKRIVEAPSTKVVFFNPAVVDFGAKLPDTINVLPGSHGERLKSGVYSEEYPLKVDLIPLPKIISTIRKERKDIFLIGFKTTTGAEDRQQYLAALDMLKRSSCNLVLANDVVTRRNMIVTPEEASYEVSEDRVHVLTQLVDMAFKRSHLTFTRSTVVSGESIPWTSELIPNSLRKAVEHCIERGAYKAFNGATVGHFAFKVNDTTFVTSKRKTNFNNLYETGMVLVKTDGPDTVLAYGAKPSVGGQSQRIIFKEHPGYDCVLHFHCAMKPGSLVPVRSQKEVECGSHQCGQNTSDGLQEFAGGIKAVFLDNHGPNIVFNKHIDPQIVIDFVEANFDLDTKTGGYQLAQR
jgi:hypothetical protein